MQKSCNTSSDLELLQSLPVLVDHDLLKDRFSDYKSPRKKVFDLAAKEYLSPIRKGLYLNLKSADRQALQLETLANSLYFPSYVSLEWALQYYGLLTERVQVITSVTMRRPAEFHTVMGKFTFEHLDRRRYPSGYVLGETSGTRLLIARPEKALLDYVNLRLTTLSWKSDSDIEEFLEGDLRLDLESLRAQLTIEQLQELVPYYHRNSKEARLLRWLLAWKKKELAPHGNAD